MAGKRGKKAGSVVTKTRAVQRDGISVPQVALRRQRWAVLHNAGRRSMMRAIRDQNCQSLEGD